MLRQTSDQPDPYAAIAEFYDLEHDQFRDDLPMYRQVVEMVGDPVIEIACGSGRILHGIAVPGRRLTGLDSSPAMLDRCRQRFEDSSEQPELVLQDMTSPNLPSGHFGVAIIGLNSLMHAISVPDQMAALSAVHQALDPRGLLVLDLMNPLLSIHDTGDARVRLERTFRREDGVSVSKFSSQEIDLAAQLIETTIWYDVVDHLGTLTRHQTTTALRFLFRSELEQMLSAVGFPASHVYGSYDLDPYLASSPRMIVFAERS